MRARLSGGSRLSSFRAGWATMRFQVMEELAEGYVLAAGDRAAAAREGAKFGGCRFLLGKACGNSEVRAERFADEFRAGPLFGLSQRLDALRHRAGQGDGQKSCGFLACHRYKLFTTNYRD